MTDETDKPARTGDLTWYSRLLLWAGAAVLLLQAISGRSTGFVTLIAVLALSIGFVAFLAGLAIERLTPFGGPSKP